MQRMGGKSRLTKKALCESFSELVEERGYNRITVKDLTDHCGVTRNTFYYHFRDLQQLLEYAMTVYMQKMYSSASKPPRTPKECISLLLSTCVEHKNLIRAIFGSPMREEYVRAMDSAVVTVVRMFVDNSPACAGMTAEERQTVARFYKSLLLGLFMDWVVSYMKYDVMDVGDTFFRVAKEHDLLKAYYGLVPEENGVTRPIDRQAAERAACPCGGAR